MSYLAIKPHIEYHFVLTPEFIAVTDDFSGANFTDEWVFQEVDVGLAKMIIMCPHAQTAEESIKWEKRTLQLKLLSVFLYWGSPYRFSTGCLLRNLSLETLGVDIHQKLNIIHEILKVAKLYIGTGQNHNVVHPETWKERE